ncbi:MAG TPA: glutamine--fructose-6-phosphate transaminase (isomerizing) [Dehalococcoidales bacterium]|nr:MAG: glutamine--fructose-6-phosphate aminotransferase [Chloroflexi bacterium RBG_16_60_22]HJX12346.1 glutamine--fructose-6-phosphate transaminase (isomerizing) [Dehalococcoidales bacterium]
MCGIVGYIGARKAQSVLLDCLGKLEYRGYDSCGIAVLNDGIEVRKDAVRVKALAKALAPLNGTTGIGHTRWATHGEPSKVNAHPQCDCTGRIAVVHNGVINNFQKLREQLAEEGHTLASQTDTEVIPHLIEKYYDGDFVKAVERALKDIEGSYTMIALMAGESRLVAARKDSPLIIGIGDRENFLASDVPALLDYTSRVIYLEDGDIAVVNAGGVRVKNNGSPIVREEHKILWSVEDAQKGGYEHFMLKEIHEQPRVIRDTLAEYIASAEPIADLTAAGGTGPEDLLILACGTSYHAGLVGKYIIEGLVKIPVRCEMADEFNYAGQVSARNKALVITQSGETTDALKAVKKLKEAGCEVIAITNVVGSTASRLADRTIYTRAGPEISVAATKTFLGQLIALYWLALPYARVDIRRLDELVRELRQLPVKVQQVLDNEAAIADIARQMAGYENIFFIGKGINYPVALEGALKLKEISYIHAEGYAAGELKHGPFALLGSRTPVVAVVAQDNTCEPVITSIKEIKARRSPVLVLMSEGDDDTAELADFVITVPQIDPLFSPVVNSVALQLLAYYVAKQRDCPIDFPRNLAKSVTVE